MATHDSAGGWKGSSARDQNQSLAHAKHMFHHLGTPSVLNTGTLYCMYCNMTLVELMWQGHSFSIHRIGINSGISSLKITPLQQIEGNNYRH